MGHTVFGDLKISLLILLLLLLLVPLAIAATGPFCSGTDDIFDEPGTGSATTVRGTLEVVLVVVIDCGFEGAKIFDKSPSGDPDDDELDVVAWLSVKEKSISPSN